MKKELKIRKTLEQIQGACVFLHIPGSLPSSLFDPDVSVRDGCGLRPEISVWRKQQTGDFSSTWCKGIPFSSPLQNEARSSCMDRPTHALSVYAHAQNRHAHAQTFTHLQFLMRILQFPQMDRQTDMKQFRHKSLHVVLSSPCPSSVFL